MCIPIIMSGILWKWDSCMSIKMVMPLFAISSGAEGFMRFGLFLFAFSLVDSNILRIFAIRKGYRYQLLS